MPVFDAKQQGTGNLKHTGNVHTEKTSGWTKNLKSKTAQMPVGQVSLGEHPWQDSDLSNISEDDTTEGKQKQGWDMSDSSMSSVGENEDDSASEPESDDELLSIISKNPAKLKETLVKEVGFFLGIYLFYTNRSLTIAITTWRSL